MRTTTSLAAIGHVLVDPEEVVGTRIGTALTGIGITSLSLLRAPSYAECVVEGKTDKRTPSAATMVPAEGEPPRIMPWKTMEDGMTAASTAERLSMPLGEAIFTQRAIRRLKPDPIPGTDLRDILEAAIRAPSGANAQPWHFLVVQDGALRARFAALYHEAWWAKRKDVGINTPDDIPESDRNLRTAMRLADEIGGAPVLVLVCATRRGVNAMGSVIPAAQNLLLAARALGVGGTITTLHAQVELRVHELLGIPESAQVVYCVPLGYPSGNFGSASRKPLSEVCSLDGWGETPAWV